MKLDFAAMFAAHVAATQKEWAHDRSLTVGASEAFRCIRGVWFNKVGPTVTTKVPAGFAQVENGVDVIEGTEYPHFDEEAIYDTVPVYQPDEPDEDGESWGATQRGDILEANYVVPAVRDNLPQGKLVFGGTDQKTLISGYNSATPDGIIIGIDRDALALYGIPDIESNCVMLEIKSIDPRVRLKEAKAANVGQVQTQMGLVWEKTPYRPKYGVLIYVNASFLDDIKIFIVKFDEEMWTAARLRAAAVFQTRDPAELMPEGKLDGECEHCKWTRACAIVTAGRIPDDNSKQIAWDNALLEEFDPIADEYQKAQEEAKAAEKRLEEIKLRVKEALVHAGTRKLGGKRMKRPYTFSWSTQKGRKSLSTALLKEALGDDLDAFKTEGNPFDVLRVTFED